MAVVMYDIEIQMLVVYIKSPPPPREFREFVFDRCGTT